MSIGYSSYPTYVSGLTATQGWLNQALDYLGAAGGINEPPVPISAPPGTPIPNRIYLVTAPATGGLTAGRIVVYTTSALSSAIVIDPPVGTYLDRYVKISGDWQLGGFFHTGYVRLTTASTTVPSGFQGICHIIPTVAGAVLNPPPATTSAGLFGVALTVGQVYTLHAEGAELTLST